MPAPRNDGVTRDTHGAVLSIGDWVSFYPMFSSDRIYGRIMSIHGGWLELEVQVGTVGHIYSSRSHRVWRLKRKCMKEENTNAHDRL